jgi:bifunctional non-homologous end joining protein LigD
MFNRLYRPLYYRPRGRKALTRVKRRGTPRPLHARKARLAKLLAKSADAIQVSEHLSGEIGPAMFKHACKLGLEGIVSKHRDRAYRAGRSLHWLKVKNPASPAMMRVEDGSW